MKKYTMTRSVLAVVVLLGVIVFVVMSRMAAVEVTDIAPVAPAPPMFDAPASLVAPPLSAADVPVDPYPPSFAGWHVTSNLKERFDANYGREEPEALLAVAEVVRNCAPVGKAGTWEDFMQSSAAGQAPQDLLDSLQTTFEHLLPECRHVNAHAKADAWEYYRQAATAGSVIAQLELLSGQEASEANRDAMRRLLEVALASGDYRAYYLASQFYVRYPDEAQPLASETWRYRACLNHPECDPRAMRAELSIDLLPREVDEIVTGAGEGA